MITVPTRPRSGQWPAARGDKAANNIGGEVTPPDGRPDEVHEHLLRLWAAYRVLEDPDSPLGDVLDALAVLS